MSGLTYKQAGVDIDKGNAFVENIKPLAKRTHTKGILGGLGGFGGGFELPDGYIHPVLISGTDGVGTKLKLALELGKHDTIGIDLVAMCVNDIIVTGAKPLFFLDYYATSELDIDVASSVVDGISQGCIQAKCSLIGGETAEMPGMYAAGEYDLAGFSVGIVEKEDIIDGSTISTNDVIIALGSSGPHSNGYSLIRNILNISSDLHQFKSDLLIPTKIYVQSILKLIDAIDVKGIAHITGGGLIENIPRILPSNIDAHIDLSTWTIPEVFLALQSAGNISQHELFKVLNCGVGMIVIVSKAHAQTALDLLQSCGELAWIIGHTSSGNALVKCS